MTLCYKETTLLKEHELFPPIEHAMRQVTGDLSLTFHHLRHSFASWLMIRLLKDFPSEAYSRFSFLNHHSFWSEERLELRNTILGNQTLGRKSLYAVAQLCGHASPQVTLLHYMHLCDWLLCQEISLPGNQPELDAKSIMHFIQLPQNIVYHTQKKQGKETWYLSTFLDKLEVPNEFLPTSKPLPIDSSHIPEKSESTINKKDIPLWRRVELVLRERQLGKVPFSVLAVRNGFSESQVQAWCTAADAIKEMKTNLGKPRHVNGATLRNNPNFLFPLPLHLKVDKKMAGKVMNIYDNSKSSTKRTLDRGVKIFIENYYVSGDGDHFTANQDALRYLRFLKLLNIPQQKIRINRVLSRTARKSLASERKALAKRFDLPVECIFVRYLVSWEYSTKGELSILVMNPPVGPENRIKASTGLKFAMYMIAIINGLTLDTGMHNDL